MNIDIRLSVEFWDHPKTVKLERRLGLAGVKSLQLLWLWSAQNRPEGLLSGMDSEDVEIVARWTGNEGSLVSCLLDLRWLDDTEEGYALHDWRDHNSWAAEVEDRSNRSRLNRMAKTHPEIYQELIDQGATGVSREDYDRLTKARRSCKKSLTTVERPLTSALSPAPAPAPAPSPSPIPAPKAISPEPCAHASEPEAPSQDFDTDEEEPDPSASDPVFIAIPTNKSGEEFPVTESQVSEFADLYPAVDVPAELRKIRAWNISNPTHRKTRSGVLRHVNAWLSKAQNAPPGNARSPTSAPRSGTVSRVTEKNLESLRIVREMEGRA